jgi:signal transduction histidine kinase
MQIAPIPIDESKRLRELYSYEVLDTATEKALDDIVQAAATLCGTTFGALSLIDRDRQWFKAQVGFCLKETLRSQSICSHGILSRSFFEVPDTQADLRFQNNELLESLGVRFYGGTQLIGAEGSVLGMLCVLDSKPHVLTDAEKTDLTTLATKAMDLLEAHRQRRRMEWLGALADQNPDEVYLFDLSTGLLLHANDAAKRHLESRPHEVRLDDFASELPRSKLGSYIELLVGGAQEVCFETWITRAEERVPVEVRWQRLKTSGHPLVTFTIRNMAGRRESDQAKQDFVSTVSHELRTPLTGLYGAIKLLQSGACGELPAAAANMVALASRGADTLLRLVNDILDLEKSTAGLMLFDKQPIALLPVLEELIADNMSAATQAGVRLENLALSQVTVLADPQRLRQILGNLVSNAMKFAPSSSTVTLNGFVHVDGLARITVTDQGPGVPIDFQSKLFERFAQANINSSQVKGGSGLGLSIVKSMVEGMGGAVSCESQPGHTLFAVDLPHA